MLGSTGPDVGETFSGHTYANRVAGTRMAVELNENATEVSDRWWVEVGRQRNVLRLRHIGIRNVDLGG